MAFKHTKLVRPKRSFIGGRLRTISGPKLQLHNPGIISRYIDNQVAVSGPQTGGISGGMIGGSSGDVDVVKRLENALSKWSMSGRGRGRGSISGRGIGSLY